MFNFFQQFQEAQAEISKIQESLQNKYAEGSAGGGKVTAVANGRLELLKVNIDPEVVQQDPDEIEFLEDMVVAAINQALEKSRELAAQEMGKLTGGMNLEALMKMMKK